MSDKEQINTLISVGTGLPPVNPYLDDSNDGEVGEDGSPKSKAGRKPADSGKTAAKAAAMADPKEYIAELERSEDENLF